MAIPGDGSTDEGESPGIQWGLGSAVVAGALIMVVLLGGLAYAMWALSWANRAPIGNPQFGINYSCDYAEFLLLEDPDLGEAGHVPDDRPDRAAWCASTLARLIDESGAEHVRLSVEWSEVEPVEGQYDFAVLDALLATASERGVSVFLTIGMKAQRHPEYYIPEWAFGGERPAEGATLSDDPDLRDAALRMAAVVVQRTAAIPAIDAWGAENEPYVPSSRASEWKLGRDYVQQLVSVIRENDPAERPIVISHGQVHAFDLFLDTWQQMLEDADIGGMSLYPYRLAEVGPWQRAVPIVKMGPFAPNVPYRANEALRRDSELWLTEMQAEPWGRPDIREYSPENPSPEITATLFRYNIEYARRSAAERVYLWGAEWWLYQLEKHGDDAYMEIARNAMAIEPAPPAPPPEQ